MKKCLVAALMLASGPAAALELSCPPAEAIREVGDVYHVPGQSWIAVPAQGGKGEVVRFDSAEIIENSESLRACTYVLANGLLDLRYGELPPPQVRATGEHWRVVESPLGIRRRICETADPALCTFETSLQ